VLFEGPLIDAFIAAGVLDPLRPVRRPRDPRIAAAWRRMLRGFADGPAHGPAIATTALLEILHRVARDTGGGDRRAGPDLADLATARIHAAPERSWTAHRLATELGVSVHRLRRAFAAATGGGITAYVLAERVRRARIVLSQGLSVAQAATSCGFADPAYFARVVCRLSGRPPSHWRPSRGRDQRAGG
jgi:transcriptional regulator GlxA family with amidase domain